MAINSNTPRNRYTSTMNQTEFTYSFRIFDASDLVVIVGDDTQTLTTDYTVSGVDAALGGTVTLTTAPTLGTTVTIYRQVPLQRTTDFQPNGDFRAETVNEEYDRIIAGLQDNQLLNSNSVLSFDQASEGLPLSTISSTIAQRANNVVGFDAMGQPVILHEIGNWRGAWVADTAYEVRDLIRDATTGSVYICIVAHTSGSTFSVGTNWAIVVDIPALNTLAVNNILASNNNWTGDQTLTDITETQVTLTGSATPDLTSGSVFILTAAGTITMPAAEMGKSFTIIVNTGTHVTWAGNPMWSRGTEPVKGTGIDIYSFWSDGTNWYGGQAGTNFS